MCEVGTLKELDVNPGDVVKNMNSHVQYTISDSMMVGNVMVKYSTDPYELISRATPAPKLWRDMTDAEKGALLLAEHEGKVIEVYEPDNWVKRSFPVWAYENAYRVRPEPKVGTVKAHGTWSPKGQMPKSSYVYEIEFETVDGHPKWNTAKVTGK